MKTATLRDLRNNFGKLENWLREGEQIQILRREQPVAVLSRPSVTEERKATGLPDFAARRRRKGIEPLSAEGMAALAAFESEEQEG